MGGAGNVGSLTLSAERGIFFHDSRWNSGANQRRRPGFCLISPCCPSAPACKIQLWAKVTQPIWLTMYFTCACSLSAVMVKRYSSYFITIYNTTVRLCNIRQPTKFGTKKNEENSPVHILGKRCVTFAQAYICSVCLFMRALFEPFVFKWIRSFMLHVRFVRRDKA